MRPNSARRLPENHCGNRNGIYLDLSAGEHTIMLGMREDGFEIDRLMLVKSKSYTPSGKGPAESSRTNSSSSNNDDDEPIIEEKNIKLVVVDSIISHFRSEYIGRGTLADRQQKLNRFVHKLLQLAEAHNLAVFITNQVQSSPGVFFGDPTKPTGGNVIAHASTYRLYLRKSKANKRVAKLIDSPCLPEAEAVFSITETAFFLSF